MNVTGIRIMPLFPEHEPRDDGSYEQRQHKDCQDPDRGELHAVKGKAAVLAEVTPEPDNEGTGAENDENSADDPGGKPQVRGVQKMTDAYSRGNCGKSRANPGAESALVRQQRSLVRKVRSLLGKVCSFKGKFLLVFWRIMRCVKLRVLPVRYR
jgi:hypothetical protein